MLQQCRTDILLRTYYLCVYRIKNVLLCHFGIKSILMQEPKHMLVKRMRFFSLNAYGMS